MILALVLLMGVQGLSAKDGDKLFDEFRKEERAEYQHVPKMLLRMGSLFGKKDMEGLEISSVKVLSLEDCDEKVKSRFVKELKSLESDGYETLVNVKDEGDRVRLFGKVKKDVIREMLIFAHTDGGDCAAVLLKGKISMDRIADASGMVK